STAKFKIDPGEQAVISAVDIKFSGEITLQPTDDDTLSVRQLQESWELSEDQAFTQEAWNREKRKLLSTMVAYRYPHAAIVESRAEVDNKSKQVRLSVHLDSGPRRHFGELTISG